jgi:hypothetical protein
MSTRLIRQLGLRTMFSEAGRYCATPSTRGTSSMERAAYHRPSPSIASLDRITNLDQENEEHLTVPHKLMSWPAINHELHARGSQFTQDLHEICSRGSSWFV